MPMQLGQVLHSARSWAAQVTPKLSMQNYLGGVLGIDRMLILNFCALLCIP